LEEINEKKKVSAEELKIVQVQYCSLQAKLSEIEVAIAKLRGSETTAVAQSCPLTASQPNR